MIVRLSQSWLPMAAARRLTSTAFALVVALSFAATGSASAFDGDGEAFDDVKAAETWLAQSGDARVAAPAPRKSLHHFVDCGHDRASHQVPAPAGHVLANGLRAPLRC